MKTIFLSAAASLMLLGSAAAAEGGPFGQASVRSSFAVNIPAVDTGSEAYPSTQGRRPEQRQRLGRARSAVEPGSPAQP